MIFYDTETCGLHGIAILIQYAEDDGPVTLYNIWQEQIIDTLKLIERFMNESLVGFNLAYDHFHLCKLYTIFSLCDPHAYPEDIIDEIAEKEPLGRDGMCLKPRAACDIMLHARKGKYQSTMARKDIRLRKIPTAIAWHLRDYLEEHIQLEDIYFSRRANKKAPRWGVFDRDPGVGEADSEFKDIVLKFKASSALKNLAEHALGAKTLRYGEIEPSTYPVELGYAPFALALSSKDNAWWVNKKIGRKKLKGYTWPGLIRQHCSHWYYNRLARQYAEDDVTYTRDLYHHLGSPAPGDDDSELACMVGANRWRGYTIDIAATAKAAATAAKAAAAAPKAPNDVKNYLLQVADEGSALIIKESTRRVVLESLVAQQPDTELGTRAQQCLEARQALTRERLLNKLLLAGRFHASYSVIGALSSRMSGQGGDLNPQGIERGDIRELFTLAHKGEILCGGDFDAFEVCIEVAFCDDEKLTEDLKSGKKIHALFGMHVYPDMTYEQILADKEKYTRSKSAVFAMIYGGEGYTLQVRLGVDRETADEAYQGFIQKYPGVGKKRSEVFNMFNTMRQPDGIGTQVIWHDPAEKIETMLGFPRYFTLENRICKTLFNIAQKPPKWFREFKSTVIRRDRVQTIGGACQSAIYGAAFAIQAANMRAAANHVIQGTGAGITKKVQRDIWDVQPPGVHPWRVQPMNNHDEVICATHKNYVDRVNTVVNQSVEGFREIIPLIKLEWKRDLKSWADK